MSTIKDKLIAALHKAGSHNSHIMTPPKAVLWLDPERQWQGIIPQLQQAMPHLLVLGNYEPGLRKGPPIWLKCMIDRTLPEADWPDETIPVLYLPGISKKQFKNVAEAPLGLQPIIEYQYSGTMWLHENGKEWTITAFLQHRDGIKVKISADKQTKGALIDALPDLIENDENDYRDKYIDAGFLLKGMYPNVSAGILKWMEQGDTFLSQLSKTKKEAFLAICESTYHFTPNHKNIRQIAGLLGGRDAGWSEVWEYFSHAPARYPNVQQYLRMAKPAALGNDLFGIPRDSWPQEIEQAEKELRDELAKIAELEAGTTEAALSALRLSHSWREQSVWNQLGYAPLLSALVPLCELAKLSQASYPSGSLDEIISYYTTKGYLADTAMLEALACAGTKEDAAVIGSCIRSIYLPWLETLTQKFQQHFAAAEKPVSPLPDSQVILFVDALRFDVSKQLKEKLISFGTVTEQHHLTALPSLTATAKPYNSPLRPHIDQASVFREFRPSLKGKDLSTRFFRDALSEADFTYVSNPREIEGDAKYWLEIGTLDSRGHEEQCGMVKRIPELLDEVTETIKLIAEQGVKDITIVTDHGWLLMPGGLPKTNLPKDLTEARWGRCALIKEGAKVGLPHHPWTWNPAVYIAYAPGISFFKANEEYAHGGLSAQECIVPQLRLNIQNQQQPNVPASIAEAKWNNLVCNITLKNTPDGYLTDIRLKESDESTSVVMTSPDKRAVKGNKARLMADDAFERQAAHLILMNKEKMILDSRHVTIGE